MATGIRDQELVERERLATAQMRLARVRATQARGDLERECVARLVERAFASHGVAPASLERSIHLVDLRSLASSDPQGITRAVADLIRHRPQIVNAPTGGGSPAAMRRPASWHKPAATKAVSAEMELRKRIRYPS